MFLFVASSIEATYEVITVGETTSGFLSPTTAENYDEIKHYQVFVPANAVGVNVQTVTSCVELRTVAAPLTPPCRETATGT
jgi:hypothetical protein